MRLLRGASFEEEEEETRGLEPADLGGGETLRHLQEETVRDACQATRQFRRLNRDGVTGMG